MTEKIKSFALELKDAYNIVPKRTNDFENTLTDFELVVSREDACRNCKIEPYEFIAKHLGKEYQKEITKEFGIEISDSRFLSLLSLIAKAIYELCRQELARIDRFDKELNHIIDKYYEKHQLSALGEMYDKCDIYDEHGREKFIEIRMKKWDKILKNDKKDILEDVILSGLYEEESADNQRITEKIVLPEISKALATFERNDLEGGLRKDAAERYKKSWEER